MQGWMTRKARNKMITHDRSLWLLDTCPLITIGYHAIEAHEFPRCTGILLALSSASADLVGISTVHGNVVRTHLHAAGLICSGITICTISDSMRVCPQAVEYT